MCGGRPKAPKVVQQAPSQPDYSAQMRQQEEAQAAIQQQNAALVAQLQEQANAMAAETAQRQAELAAPPPEPKTVTNANPYAVTTAQGTAGAAQEQTTAPAAPRKKGKASLQINSADISLPGVGINIGVG
jgi:hypothetical protein